RRRRVSGQGARPEPGGGGRGGRPQGVPRRRREQVGRRPMSLTPLEEVQAAVLRQCLPLTRRAVDLQDALGCVTSAPLEAEELVPPFDNTAMDGFAVQAVDTTDPPVELKIVGTLAAGADPSGVEVGAG